MINDKQKDLVLKLNEMYQLLNNDQRNRYAATYFDILNYIMNPNEVYITGEQICREIEENEKVRTQMNYMYTRQTNKDELQKMIEWLSNKVI